jgi:shikimate kinase
MASAPRQNVILMGPPGAGKSSAAKYLGRKLEMPVYDIDDDHLEQLWGCSVAEKLAYDTICVSNDQKRHLTGT